MKFSDLKPAHQLAEKYGAKIVVFGGPGSGKTPLSTTAPNPILIATEPGLLSLRGHTIATIEAHTRKQIDDIVKWCCESKESSAFQTLVIDSLSNLSEIILDDEQSKNSHGLKAYGNMASAVLAICNRLFYLQSKHVVMIAKQAMVENGRQQVRMNGETMIEPILQKRPYFPGKDLNIKVPHLFDSVFHMGLANLQSTNTAYKVNAIRTRETEEIFARDRSGRLSEIEEPNLTQIFGKMGVI